MATTNLTIGTGSGGVGTSTTTLSTVFNIAGNGQAVDLSLYNAFSPAVVQSLDLASGFNAINTTTCPALARAGGVFLIPPAGNTQTLTLKGVTGDTGIALSLTAPTFLSLTTSPPNFGITAGGTVTGFKLAFV